MPCQAKNPLHGRILRAPMLRVNASEATIKW
jgi:hypothetical protein